MSDVKDCPLQPSQAVSVGLQAGVACAATGDYIAAASRYADAAMLAAETGDRAGYGRALAQLAALEESCGEIEEAFSHNRLANETFLAIGDGAGLLQTFRLAGFLHLRTGEHLLAANAFAKALGLALQLDTRLVMTTLNQVIPAARYLVDAEQLAALLPLGVALTQAVESVAAERGAWPQEMADFSELAATIGGVLAPLGVMATEPDLTAEQRRNLAARSTHQAWAVDALTRQRWALAILVKETLTKLDFHEELD